MLDPQELRTALGNFTGTTQYHRLWGTTVLTDGAQYLAEAAGAFWLMDVIASHLLDVPSTDNFAVAALTVDRGTADFVLSRDRDNGKAVDVFGTQHIWATDFPLNEIVLFVGRDAEHWVIMLPSEY